MVDTVSTEARSRIMAQVRSKNTKPELRLRKALFARGFRYRLHARGLPGKPDLVFPARKAVIFVHGCQWHWHGCPRCRMPATNVEYWQSKIERNQARDREQIASLRSQGWRVLIVWECALKVSLLEDTIAQTIEWLRSDEGERVIEPAKSDRTLLR